MPEEPLVDPRIAVRFGDALLSHGYTVVPNLVLKYYAQAGITEGELLFIQEIWMHWWSAQNPFPSLGAVALRMRKDVRQVRRYEASLIEKGLLRVIDRRDPERGQLTNEFDFAPLLRRILELARQAGDIEDASRDDGIRRTVRGTDKSDREGGDRNVRGGAGTSVRGRKGGTVRGDTGTRVRGRGGGSVRRRRHS